jgi:hypothetical protein
MATKMGCMTGLGSAGGAGLPTLAVGEGKSRVGTLLLWASAVKTTTG